MYSLLIKNAAGSYINEITNHKGFNYNFELNREGECHIPINVNLLDKFTMGNLYPRKSYLDIYRYDTKVWSGIFSDVTGDIGTGSGRMTLNFKGYLWLLKKMKVSPAGKIITATDQGSIIWELINDFQSLPNGDYGITAGNIITGVTRDRTYQALKDIYEAASELTEVINGCDLEITADKALNVYAHKGHRLSHVLEYGKNVSGISFSIDGKDVVNNSFAIGSGEGIDLLYSTAHNMQSQEEFGLAQGVVPKADVILSETLSGYAQGMVNEYGIPTMIIIPEIMVTNDPPLFSYSIGDEIRIKIKYDWFDIDTYKRIKKIAVNVTTENKENVSVEFQN